MPIDIALETGDADGDALTLQDFDDPAGIVSGKVGLSLTIIAPAAGRYQVTYRVNDGTESSRLATITVNVTDPPPPPPPEPLPEPPPEPPVKAPPGD